MSLPIVARLPRGGINRRAVLSPPVSLAASVGRCDRCRRMSHALHSAASSHTVSATATSPSSFAAPRRASSLSSSASLFVQSRLAARLSSSSFRQPARFATTGSGGGILSGLSSRLTGAVSDRRAAAADNKFASMVGEMLAVNKYGLSDHLRFMEQTAADAGVSGWKSYMPGVSSQAGVEELKRILAILQSFTPSERADVGLIGREERLRVATATGRTVADVNFVLRQFSGSVLVHQWLHSRKTRGLPLPTTQSELANMMAIDRPQQTQQMKHKPRRR